MKCLENRLPLFVSKRPMIKGSDLVSSLEKLNPFWVARCQCEVLVQKLQCFYKQYNFEQIRY
ncbi:hypothetical protein BpHYR1_052420 [Brachionus plicatilis]|uniref:Uncharacterized protein n=1 Tax=Brachionus plicatilis TaxID=10195 RepID=A0A3M7QY71_BRAPC|nr:hypothetical protein BpHYR1_052420 [Brachionus plicatilis]